MEYRDILRGELCRSDREDGGYDVAQQQDTAATNFYDANYLLRHVPDEGDVLAAMLHLAGLDHPADHPVPLLVPIRPYLQAKLCVTSQRLEELISDDDWVYSWIDYAKAVQEVRIIEEFSGSSMEDSTLKWLPWAVLGETVDPSSPRTRASIDASRAPIDVNIDITGDHHGADCERARGWVHRGSPRDDRAHALGPDPVDGDEFENPDEGGRVGPLQAQHVAAETGDRYYEQRTHGRRCIFCCAEGGGNWGFHRCAVA
jgi:hypothetical protein